MSNRSMAHSSLFLRIRHTTAPEPNSCRYCGRNQLDHGLYSVRSVGLHSYAEPTNEQRKARIRARKNTL